MCMILFVCSVFCDYASDDSDWTYALNLCLSCLWYYIDYIAHSRSVNLLVWRLVDMVAYLYGSAFVFYSLYS